MIGSSARGFKINNILDRLALDMLRIFDQCLTAAPFDRDRFHLAILLTLSRRVYVNNLLYRDFRVDHADQWHSYVLPDGGHARIHEQSMVYLHRVLARRPKLARRLKHEPGNMHLLLAILCRFGPTSDGWAAIEIRRDKTVVENDQPLDFFEPLGRELAAQRRRLGDDYGDEARRRRGEYGPIWLIRGSCAAEAPEEMSLFDVVEAVPVPLGEEFSSDQDLQRLVVRVMDSLNERYTLLRSCGLDPEIWHDREEPSIGRLREMKRLRQQAEELLRLSIEEDRISAYRRGFAELMDGGKQYAGCSDFDEFATSEAGMVMLRYATLSLDDAMSTDDEGDVWLRHESLADPDAPDVEENVVRQQSAGHWVQALIEDRPGWFDPVMRYFFLEVLGNGRPIHSGPGEQGLLGDPVFLELMSADPELADLDEAEQAERLYERADKLIKRGLKRRAMAES